MIRIITDSASDVTQAQAKEMGIDVLPLKTSFGETEYLDGVDITIDEFFEKLIESDVVPKTSCAAPGQYMEAFDRYKDDEIIVICVAGKLSGCYQSARIAAEGRENVYVIDSETVTIGQRILIQLALKMIEEGKSAKEIAAFLEEDKKNIQLVAMLETLEYLKKGGRISAATAAIGGLLSIKPVVEVKGGEILIIGKARGSKNAQNLLNQHMEKHGGIRFDKPFSLAYSGLSDALIRKYVEDNRHLYEGKTDVLPMHNIGSSIGTHAGPGAIAIAYFSK